MAESSASRTSPTQLFSLEGGTAVVTGAAAGLGRDYTHFLLDSGCRVVAIDRSADGLAGLTRHTESDALIGLAVDVTDSKAVAAAVGTALAWSGGIDYLINNAGITVAKPPEEETPEEFAHVIDVNVNGVFSFCREVGRAMLERGSGSIVNIASINGLVASVGEAGYCASKGAVISLTRELAAQWSARGVRVNAIAPGYFRSSMTSELFDDPAGLVYMSGNPMGRPGAPGELLGPLAFLLSGASSYVTGHTLVVDGGWTII